MKFFLSFEAYGKGASILSDFLGQYTELLNQSLNRKNYGEELTEIAYYIHVYAGFGHVVSRKVAFYKEG